MKLLVATFIGCAVITYLAWGWYLWTKQPGVLRTTQSTPSSLKPRVRREVEEAVGDFA